MATLAEIEQAILAADAEGNEEELSVLIPEYERLSLQQKDTGQGYVTSALSSVGRGLSTGITGPIGGAGYLLPDVLGGQTLVDTAAEMEAGIQEALPVNPIYEDTFGMKAFNVLGQAGSMLATGGAGGIAGKALSKGGTQLARQAAVRKSAERAALGSGFLSGSQEGGRAAEQYQMEGINAYLRALGGGATEVLTEKFSPFGMATETGAARRLLGETLQRGKGAAAKDILSEGVEEMAANTGGNVLNKLFAPAGVETPGIFEGNLEAGALGAVGGTLFAGVNAAAGAYKTPADEAQEAEFPGTATPPISDEESKRNFAAGGKPVIGADGVVRYASPDLRDTAAGVPVVVEGVTIATIPPGSDLSPDDVAAFVGMPDGPAVLKRYADQGRIVLPEIVKPVEGVDETLTKEMSDTIAAGAATAPATVDELKKQQALYEAETLARERQAAEETLRQQEAERVAAEEQEAQRLAEEEQTAAREAEERQKRYEAMRAEQSVKLELTPDESGATGAGMKEEIQQTPLPKGTEIEHEGEMLTVVGYEDDGRMVVQHYGGGWSDLPAGTSVKVLPLVDNPYGGLVSDVEKGFDFLDRLGLQEPPESAPRIPEGRLPRGTRFFRSDFKPTGSPTPPSYALTPEGLLYEDSGRGMTHGGVSPWRLIGKLNPPAPQPITPTGEAPTVRTTQAEFLQEKGISSEAGITPRRRKALEKEYLEWLDKRGGAHKIVLSVQRGGGITTVSDWRQAYPLLPPELQMDLLKSVVNSRGRKSTADDIEAVLPLAESLMSDPESREQVLDGNRIFYDISQSQLAGDKTRARARELYEAATAPQPITPTGEAPTDSLPADQPTSGDVGTPPAVQRDVSKPEQMTPEEYASSERDPELPKNYVLSDGNGNFVTQEKSGTYKVWRLTGTHATLAGTIGKFADGSGLERAKRRLQEVSAEMHEEKLGDGVRQRKPVSAAAVDAYKITLPEGYVRQGELYVFQPTVTTANETPIDAANVDGGSQGVQSESAGESSPTVTEDTVSISDIPSTVETPLSRGKPRESIVFKTPIRTPLGDVIGYSWSSQLVEDMDKDGEPVFRRVSNWEEAANNAETGRDIVHRFLIRKPDGSVSEVSLESTLGKMTAPDKKTIKSVISAAKRLPFMRAELAELQDLQKRSDEDYQRTQKLTPDPAKFELREPDVEWRKKTGDKVAYLDGVFLEYVRGSDLNAKGELPNKAKAIYDNTWKWQGAQRKVEITAAQTDRIKSLTRSVKKAEELLKKENVEVAKVTTDAQPASLAETGPPVREMKTPSVTTDQPAPTPKRPSLGNTGKQIIGAWRSLQGVQVAPGETVVGWDVNGGGTYAFINDRLVKLRRNDKGFETTYAEATDNDWQDVSDALDRGALQVEVRKITGLGGYQKSDAGKTVRVLHQATGRPLQEFLDTPEGAAYEARMQKAVAERGPKEKPVVPPSTAETSSQQFTSDTIEDTLTSTEKLEAATELGHSSWGKEALEDFKARLADWLVTGKTASKKLAAIFKRLVNSAKALAVAGLSAISVNTGDARVTAESGNAPVQPVAFRAVLSDMPAPRFRFPAGLPQSRPLPQAQQRGVLLPRPRTPRVADFGGVRAPAEVVNTANWVVDNDDTQGRPFVIADKKRGWVYVFNADGSLEGRNPAIFGKDTGDTREKGTRVTPSGRFEATVDPDAGPLYGTTVDFLETEESVLAIHRVYLPEAKERRRALESKGGADNRMSHGCINVEDTFYDDTLQPLFSESGGVVYILPETKSGAKPSSPRSPAENLVSFTAANGQKLVGEVQSVTGNKATVAYQWNGKTKTQVVPVSQLGSPVASVATPPKYQYNQEQNTRKLGKHFPTALGVHANHDFRKSFASMAKDTSLGQDYQMIAKLLSNMPEFKGMDLHLVADENIKYAGEYSWNRGKPSIAINLRLIARGQVDALGSILHEALHHVTLAKVRNPQGEFENEVVSKLDLIRESVREYAESKGFGERLDYELGSTEEFITALFTRPDFQAFIASIPDSAAPAVAVGKFRSVLSELFRLIAELIHGKPVLRGSALEQAMTTSLALFNTPFRAIETGGLEALNAARSYAGERAQMPQFMRDSLETAQAMAAAGKTSEEIRAVTGWFPGKYDGKMRFEVPDEGANLKLIETIQAGYPANDVLTHPSLFKTYPSLSKVRVAFVKMPNERRGALDPFGNGKIEINEDLTNAEKLSTLIHEIQHWIQDKEGFSSGGNPAQSIRNARLEANEKIKSLNEEITANNAVKIEAKFRGDDAAYEKAVDAENSLIEARNKAWEIGQQDPYELYRSLAGEIEARDVQARQRFTPEQRKAIAPYSSENIAKEDAIVMFGGSGAQASMGKGVKALFPQTGDRAAKPINLSAAYQRAAVGKSSQWVTIKEVYEQAKADNPALTPETFMAQINQQNDNGEVFISPVENSATVEAARPFVIGNAGVEMMVPSGTAASRIDEETDAEYMAAVESGDVAKQQAMVDAAAKAAGYDIGPVYHGTFAKEIFHEFDLNMLGTGADQQENYQEGYSGRGFYFDPIKSNADQWAKFGEWEPEGRKARTIAAYLKMEKPVMRTFHSDAPKPTPKDGDGVIALNERGTPMEYVAFNPNQIKSADPVTRDEQGNVIPLSQRFNPESPSILYAAPIDTTQSSEPDTGPARGRRDDLSEGLRREGNPVATAGGGTNPASVLARLDAGREAAVSAAVAESDWENYTPEQKTEALNAFIRSVYGAADYSSWAQLRDISGPVFTRGSGDSASVRGSVGADGRLNLELTYDNTERVLGAVKAGESARNLFAFSYDVAQEEIIHAADKVAAFRRWVAAGRPGTFLEFERSEAKATVTQINQTRLALQESDPDAAQKIKDAMLASWNIYRSNDPVTGVAGLMLRLERTKNDAALYLYELRRQLTQLKRQDFTTETGWQKFRNMLQKWITDAINSLRGVQDVFRSGMAGDLIQRQLADLEAALDGKPLPPVSRPAASRADDGDGVIDVGGEAEPADGGGTQLFQKDPTAIGSTFITPADITLQERRSQEETLAKARKIIAEEVQKDEKGGRAVALQRFKSDMSIPPEVRTAGSGLIAQQADLLANLERDAIKQEGLDALADEAGKVSGIIGSDLEYWRNLQLAANLDIDKMAEEAGRTLNIFNVFRRLTPEGFLRRMKRQYNATVQESISQNFDIPPGEVEAEIMRLWRMMREAGATARGEAIAAALKAFMPRRVNTRKIIESLFPQAGIRQRMSKGGEALVRNFFQMMAGPRDQKGPLAEFDESIQNALSGMLRKVMEANGLVAKNQSNQATDIDKLVRSVSADELRFDKIAAADEAMQKELDAIEDPERRSTLRQAWEEATAKMYTNIASDTTVRRAINAELKGMNVDWRKMFDSNQKPDAVKARVVDAVMTKIEGLLTGETDATAEVSRLEAEAASAGKDRQKQIADQIKEVQSQAASLRQNLNMLRDEVEAAFDFIAANKRTEWLAYREGVEARRRVAEHRAAFMEALRNQGVAEDALLRISKKLLAGPLPQKPDQNPVSALVGEHMKEEDPNFVDKLVALDVDRATAEQLDTAAKALRADIAEVEKLKAAERAVKKLMDSLKPKPRAPREKIEKALKALFTAAETGALDSQEFFDAFGEAFGHPPLTPEQQERIKKLTREINSLPKGAARVDKQQELDEELALWKGIAARDVLLSAWYANILSGISTQGIGLFGNLANFLPRSLFLAATNPRSAMAYFQGAFGEGLKTGIKEAQAALKGRGLYKVSKYGDKNMVSALELLRKKGPATLPEWIAYIASAGTNLRYVFRVMQAIDALAWNTAREGHAYLAAHRALLDQQRADGVKRSPEEFSRALIENLGGDAKRIEEDMRAAREDLIARGQTPDQLTVDRMAREARNARRSSTGTKPSNRFADRIVMQQDPEGIGDVISSIITVIQKKGNFMGVPFGQLLIPFNKIVANLFEQSLDYTPVGALRSYLGGHLTDIQSIDWSGKVQFKDKSVQFDAVERAERMAASVTGTLAASVLFALASMFKDEPDEDVPFMIYGFGPESKNKRDQMPKGWTPYSVKVGDAYIKFSEMPFGVMFAAAGNALDAMRYKNMDNKSSAERLAYVLKTSAKGFTEQGVLSSFDTALEVLTFQASDKKFTDVPVNVAKGMVPGQGMLRDISVLFDPVKIKDDTIASAFLRDFPVVRRIGTRPALNVFGEPMTFDGRIPFVRRIGTLREKHPVADYLGRNGLSIPGMAQTIVVGQYLPKDMKDRIQRRALQTSAMENGVFTVEQDYNFRKRAGELTKAAVEGLLTQVPTITSDKQRENVQNLINRKVEAARRRAMLEAVPAQ